MGSHKCGLANKATQTDDDWLNKYMKKEPVNPPRKEHGARKGARDTSGDTKWRYDLMKQHGVNMVPNWGNKMGLRMLSARQIC